MADASVCRELLGWGVGSPVCGACWSDAVLSVSVAVPVLPVSDAATVPKCNGATSYPRREHVWICLSSAHAPFD